jgi:Bacterial Ig domain
VIAFHQRLPSGRRGRVAASIPFAGGGTTVARLSSATRWHVMRRILTTGLSLASLAYAAMASARTGTALQSPPPAPQPAPNRPPTITVACEPCTVDVGQTARLTAAAIDPDGDVLVYHWTAPAGTLADANQAQTTWTAPQEEGSVAITAVADDGRGGTASDYVRIVIKRPPRSRPDRARVAVLKGDHDVRAWISRGGTNDIVNAPLAVSATSGR